MSEKLQQIISKQNNSLFDEDSKNKNKNEKQLVCFMVGDEEFGVSILNIQEIIKPISWTRVPQTPKYVLGVFNLRGSVIPLIELRTKFLIPDKKHDLKTRIIVIKNDKNRVGFTIDSLTESIRIPIENIETSLSEDERSSVEGVAKLPDRIITILKIDHLLNRDF
jgi:purine-binding chemotaxis protein CheW